MLITFRAPQGEDSLELHTAMLRSIGVSLRDGDNQEIALHVRGLWRRLGQEFLSFAPQGAVRLTFENQVFGEVEVVSPVTGVQFIDSSIWAGADTAEPKLVAEFDLVLEAWHLRIRPGVAMPILTIAPAANA